MTVNGQTREISIADILFSPTLNTLSFKESKMELMVSQVLISSPAPGCLRRMDPQRDLRAVADLIELCFQDTLDPEGRSYLQSMREAANSARWMSWAGSFYDQSPTPPTGYVWEEEGQILGNLSLLPIKAQGQHCYLIANVAVHPERRGQGIARQLTTAAMEFARSRRVPAVWLQVREDNPTAIHIYQVAGFRERARRTTWHSTMELPELTLPPGMKIGSRRPFHWEQQRRWLQNLYPAELSWHLPLNWSAFRPDLWGTLYRLFLLESTQHWVAERYGSPVGVLTWREGSSYADWLWLAVPPEPDKIALEALLIHARRCVPKGRPLMLDLPASLAPDSFRAAGFHSQQTLIWMEYRF